MDENNLRNFYTSINKNLNFLNDVSLNANGEETIGLINKTINQYSHSDFIKKCVSEINSISKNNFEFCKNLFEISCALVKYRRDPPGHEIVFTPLLLMRVGEGDCKKFTTWICAVLKCKGIPSASKVVNYDEEYGWQHIYAIAFKPDGKGYIILDPVNYKQFNKEVSYRIGRINFYDGNKGKLDMTKLSIMGNIPEKNETFLGIGEAADELLGDLEDISGRKGKFRTYHRGGHKHQIHQLEQDYISGISEIISPDEDMSGLDEMGKKSKAKRVEKRKAKKVARKEKRKKIIKKAKKVGFAPVRAAFLALIAAGGALAKHTPIKFNLAVKVAKLWQSDNGATMKNIWAKFGGKPESLKKALIKASGIQINGLQDGIGSAAVVIASVTAAAPILTLVIKALVDKKILSKQDASKSAAIVEDIEHVNTTPEGDLNTDLTSVLKTATPFIDDAVSTDDGGDKQAQKVIKETVTPNDQTTTTTPPQNTFTSQSTNPPEEQRTSSPTEDKPNVDEPTDTSSDQHAAGFNLLNASSWLTGSFQFPIGMNIILPGHDVITGIVSISMLSTSIYLFLNNYFKTKTIKHE